MLFFVVVEIHAQLVIIMFVDRHRSDAEKEKKEHLYSELKHKPLKSNNSSSFDPANIIVPGFFILGIYCFVFGGVSNIKSNKVAQGVIKFSTKITENKNSDPEKVYIIR